MAEEAAKTSVFAVDLAEYPMGWFTLRITVDDRSGWVNNDITGDGDYALLSMEIIGGWMGKGTAKGYIVFDDESLDGAELHIIERMDGWSRVMLTYEPGPWNGSEHAPSPSGLPRIDVLVRTPQLVSEVQRATAAFRVIDTVEPREKAICGYAPTMEELFKPQVWRVSQSDGSMKEVMPAFRPPWQHVPAQETP